MQRVQREGAEGLRQEQPNSDGTVADFACEETSSKQQADKQPNANPNPNHLQPSDSPADMAWAVKRPECLLISVPRPARSLLQGSRLQGARVPLVAARRCV
jgi:hypothetical protein